MARVDHADPGSQGVPSLTLAEVLAGLRQGSDTAATEFSMALLAELLRYAGRRLSMTTPPHQIEAQDLVQAVLLELCKETFCSPMIFPDLNHLRAYLHRVLDGGIREHRRASRTAKRCHVEESLELARHDQASAEPDQAAVAEVEDELLVTLHGLPPPYGWLIAERRGGATIEQAAKNLGISQRTAQRWLNAVAQLLAARH